MDRTKTLKPRKIFYPRQEKLPPEWQTMEIKNPCRTLACLNFSNWSEGINFICIQRDDVILLWQTRKISKTIIDEMLFVTTLQFLIPILSHFAPSFMVLLDRVRIIENDCWFGKCTKWRNIGITLNTPDDVLNYGTFIGNEGKVKETLGKILLTKRDLFWQKYFLFCQRMMSVKIFWAVFLLAQLSFYSGRPSSDRCSRPDLTFGHVDKGVNY